MNTSLISRFFAAVAACLGLAQAAVAHDSIAAETDSVWIFSDRYISAEHEFSESHEPLDARHVRPTRPRVVRLDLCEPFAARLLSTASSIPWLPVVRYVHWRLSNRHGCVAVNRVPFREATKMHNGPTQPGRRTSTDKLQARPSKSAVHNKLLLLSARLVTPSASPALAQVGAFSRLLTGHKRLHLRTEQPRATSSLMHSRQLAGHDKPQEKDT